MASRIVNYTNFNDQKRHSKIDIRKYTLMEFARKIADKLGYEVINYIDFGTFGSAFKITKFKVLKLTTDIREVYTAKMLMDKKTEHIVNYYDVKKIESPFLKTELYAIVMDYVFSLKDGNKKNKFFFDFLDQNFTDFEKDIFDQNLINNIVDKYKKGSDIISDKQIEKNLKELKQLALEAKELGIYPLDIHSGNLGYKFVDSKLLYFDVGVNTNYKIVPIEKIIID